MAVGIESSWQDKSIVAEPCGSGKACGGEGISEIMMIRVLAVVGSPRKGGNTDILVSRIAEGAGAAGAQVETIHLGALQIRECDGCHACWKGRPCTKNDDMRTLYAKIAASEMLVLGTPVY